MKDDKNTTISVSRKTKSLIKLFSALENKSQDKFIYSVITEYIKKYDYAIVKDILKGVDNEQKVFGK